MPLSLFYLLLAGTTPAFEDMAVLEATTRPNQEGSTNISVEYSASTQRANHSQATTLFTILFLQGCLSSCLEGKQ